MTTRGVVYLVGAGPGHAGLITVLGRDLLRRADVVACDRLVGRALLNEVKREAEIIHVGKTPGQHDHTQEQIHTLLIDRARAGKLVVRLKGGDPYVFGRGFEELSACRNAGVDCYVVPGVTSAVAVPASAGISVTDRRFVRSFAVFTAKSAHNSIAPPVDYGALARVDTVVVLMGREALGQLARSLIEAGRDPSTPAASIEWGTTSRQRVTTGTLATIADAADRDGLAAPIVTVLGEMAACADDRSISILGPLFGRRIVVTRPGGGADTLTQLLEEAGAEVVHAPLNRVEYLDQAGALDDAIVNLDRYDWLVFTSNHGVEAFWRRLAALNRDTRSLGRCQVAVVGTATAAALERRGIKPDLVPASATGDGLAETLVATIGQTPARLLYPRSDLASPNLANRLRAVGVIVDDIVAYRTVGLEPDEATRQTLNEGVDAIVFFSPSAVRRFDACGLGTRGATVACIGPTTAAAIREIGLSVDVVAAEHTSDGLVAALIEHFAG